MVNLVVSSALSEPLSHYLMAVAAVYTLLAAYLLIKWVLNNIVADISPTKTSMILVMGFMLYALVRSALLLATAFRRYVDTTLLIIPTLVYLLVSALLLWVWGRYCNQLRPRFDLPTRWYYNLFTVIVLFVAVAGITITTVCELMPNQTSDGACLNADTALDIFSCELTGLMLLFVSIDLKEVFVLSGSYNLDLRIGGGFGYYFESFFALRNLPWRIFAGLRIFSTYSLLRGFLLIAYIFGGKALDILTIAMVLFYTVEIIFLVACVTVLIGPPSSKLDPRHRRRLQHQPAVENAATRLLAMRHSSLSTGVQP